MVKDIWFKELHTEDSGILFRGRVLFHQKSDYQEILVIENSTYGRILVLDGCVMTTEKDEAFYHEMLVHPALMTHEDPKRVLIIGGGDGGALRETLKHPVERVVLVELDQMVLDVAKEFFSNLSKSFEDPRALVLAQDGVEFVKETKETFDIIIVDSPDPIGFAKELFSQTFYKNAYKRLDQGGILVAQTESPLLHMNLLKRIKRHFEEIFFDTRIYLTVVPTYPGALWSFTMGALKRIPEIPRKDPPPNLRVYSIETHRAAFALPPFVNDAIS